MAKPRQVVEDLRGGPQVQAPGMRPTDTYQGAPGRANVPDALPDSKNPLLQMSQALSTLQPGLNQLVYQQSAAFSEEEYAKGAEDAEKNLTGWNKAIKDELIKAGASPHYQRAYESRNARMEAYKYDSYINMELDKAGDVLTSDKPEVFHKWLSEKQKAYRDEHMAGYAPIIVNGTFDPLMNQANAKARSRYLHHRVAEHTKAGENAAGAEIDQMLSFALKYSGNGDPASYDPTVKVDQSQWKLVNDGFRDRPEAEKRYIGQRIEAVGYDKLDGFVTKGGAGSKFNELVIEGITAKAIRERNTNALELLDYVPSGPADANGKRSVVGRTKLAIEKRDEAEYKIHQLIIQEKKDDEWERQLKRTLEVIEPHQDAAYARQTEDYRRLDEQYEHTVQQHQQQKGSVTREAVTRDVEGHILRSLHEPNSAAKIDKDLMILADVNPTAHMTMVHFLEAVKVHALNVKDDPATVVALRNQIALHPLEMDMHTIGAAVEAKKINSGTYLALVKEWEGNLVNASHPFIRQPEFQKALEAVKKGVLLNVNEDTGIKALQANDAQTELMLHANLWLEEHKPGDKGYNKYAFQLYIKEQEYKIAAKYNSSVAEAIGDNKKVEVKKEQASAQKQRMNELTTPKSIRDVADQHIKPAAQPQQKKPSQASLNALRGDPTPKNVVEFIKRYGMENLPESMQ